MIRLRRASAITAFSLLTSAATAQAECAWILWAGAVAPWVETRSGGPPWKVSTRGASVWTWPPKAQRIRRIRRGSFVASRHRGPARGEGQVNVVRADVERCLSRQHVEG
jgi:hypothetical protein